MTVGEASRQERAHSAAAGRGRISVGRGALSADRGRPGTREGEDQLVFGAAVAGAASDAAVVWPSRIEIRHDDQCVARHQRCYGRGHQILNLEHYLDVLEKKPGAMAGSTPLEQWRQAGRWPECLDRIWEQLEQRHGKSGGTREMITLVRVGSVAGWERLIAAVEEALRLGVTDAAAVLHILNMPDPEAAPALCHRAGGRAGAVRASDAGDGRVRSAAGQREASNEEPDGELWNTPACGSTARRCACRPSRPTSFPWPSRR